MNIQDWFALGWLVGSPCCPRDSQESSPTPQFKSTSSSVLSFLYSLPSHPYMTTGKAITLTRWTCVGKIMSLLFNMMSRLVIAFLPRTKCLNCMAAVTICSDLGAQKIKPVNAYPSICHEVMIAMILVFWMLSFKSTFSLSFLTFNTRLFSSSLCYKGGIICISEVIDIFPSNLIPACASSIPEYPIIPISHISQYPWI